MRDVLDGAGLHLPEVRLVNAPRCLLCTRERTVGDPDHPMDAYDYNPLQVVTGQPLGWYSGDDGEVCPDCMLLTMHGTG